MRRWRNRTGPGESSLITDALDGELLRLQGLSGELYQRLPTLPHDTRLHARDLERPRDREHVAARGDGLFHHVVQLRVTQMPADHDGLDCLLVDEGG